jgi:hypothetical protein
LVVEAPFFFFEFHELYAHVWLWTFTRTKKNWFGFFVWKWNYDKWKGVNFPKMLSFPNSNGREEWDNNYHFLFIYFFSSMNCMSSCVSINIYWNKRNLIWTLCVEMALWQMEGVNFFHKNYNCHSLVLPKNGIIATFFSDLRIFWGANSLCLVWV